MSWLKRTSRRRVVRPGAGRRRIAAFEVVEDRTLLATFMVTNANDSGAGSLRQAILDANAGAGADSIEFSAGLAAIRPATALPNITGPTTFNAGGTAGVVIDGGGGSFSGLSLVAGSDGSRVLGLTIQGFVGAGIGVFTNDNVIQGNTLRSNSVGVQVAGSGNTIGGTGAGQANTVGPNSSLGVVIASGLGNVVSGNLYDGANGTPPGGDIALGVGANNGVESPSIVAATPAGGGVELKLADLPPSAPAAIEVYEIDAAGAGRRVFLGGTTTTASSSGTATITLPGVSPALGSRVVATATIAGSGTSAFSNVQTVADLYTVINTSPSGAGSLHQVLTNVNASAGARPTVTFAIPDNSVINVSASNPLPRITQPVFIDASAAQNITIQGSGNPAYGFELAAGSGGSEIRGLTIQDFAAAGIRIASDGNVIRGNTLRSSLVGVLVQGSDNTIGGTGSGQANTVGPNLALGVSIASGLKNVISGNRYVGANGAIPGGDISLSAGANNGVAPPSIVSASPGGGDLELRLDDLPPSAVAVIEVYQFDESGAGERVFLGGTTATASSSGAATITLPGVSPASGSRVVATATFADSGTSTFSNIQTISDLYTVTTTSSTGSGSLRQVLANVNASAGARPTVTFAIPDNSVINVSASNPLPSITQPVFIDGSTVQNLTIQGSGGATAGVALAAGSGGSEIRGLIIQGFAGAGISISSDDNVIRGNTLRSNNVGVQVAGSGNMIGGTAAGQVNTIGPNSSLGVSIVAGDDNIVSRNRYVDANGTIPAGDISLSGGANNGVAAPTIATASPSGANVELKLTGLPVGGGAAIEIYLVDSSGAGQRVFVNSATTPAGSTTATITIPTGSLSIGSRVVATATVAGSGTSAFSNVQVIGDLYTVTHDGMDGVGSLFQVLTNVNRYGGPSPTEVVFDIPANSVIDVSASNPLPPITRPVFINASTAQNITLKGDDHVAYGLALAAGSGGSEIRGLTIQNFAEAGINISSDGNTIRSNTIESSAIGVLIASSNNKIGGPGNGDGNTFTIGSNGRRGVAVVTGTGNSILGNEYKGDGVPGASNLANYIVVSPGANGGITPPIVHDAAHAGGIIFLQLEWNSSDLDVSLEIYGFDPATGAARSLGTKDETLKKGMDPLVLRDLKAPRDHERIIVTATNRSADPSPNPNLDSTSAFSNMADSFDSNVVRTTLDLVDGVVVPGSLRSAIQYVNNSAETEILFNISTSSKTIKLESDLPKIEKGVVVDGGSQPGFALAPLVILSGAGAKHGLIVSGESANHSVIRGLAFDGFTEAAIKVDGADYVTIAGNHIGVTPSGGEPSNPNTVGVLLVNSHQSRIGGEVESEANTIGYNSGAGIHVDGGEFNQILGNNIGFTATRIFENRTKWRSSGKPKTVGVLVENSGWNYIGDLVILDYSNNQFDGLGSGNLIGGHDVGVWIKGDAAKTQGNMVQGNYIGVNPYNPTRSTPGNDIGVLVEADDNTVGGWTDAGEFNVIGNNHVAGVQIDGANSVTVAGNYIGLDRAWNSLGNGDGVWVSGGGENKIGEKEGGYNVIGFNKRGIHIDDGKNNHVQFNYIGTSADGRVLGNTGSGVHISGAGSSGNTIGVVKDKAYQPSAYVNPSNVIAYNAESGVEINGGIGNRVSGNEIRRNIESGVSVVGGEKNRIGGELLGDGLSGLANLILINGGSGVSLNGGKDNFVQGNQISQNAHDGVRVKGDLGGSSRVATISGNFIGTDRKGETVYGAREKETDRIGNGLNGVLLETQTGVGAGTGQRGTAAVVVSGNTISGNGLSGITAQGGSGNGLGLLAADILNNVLGLDRSGLIATTNPSGKLDIADLPLGNVLNGVRIDRVVGMKIGEKDRGNVISGNLGRGVEIVGVLGLSTPDGWENLVMDNRIGVDTKGGLGVPELGNLSDGVFLFRPNTTRILLNVIGGNRGAGIHVSTRSEEGDSPQIVPTGNQASIQIENNRIGVGYSGEDRHNGADGVFLDRVTSVGGASIAVAVVGNIISWNRANGVSVHDSTYVEIRGNRIGGTIDESKKPSDPNKQAYDGNSGNGVFLSESSNISVGGAKLGDGNIIAGNQASGVLIIGNYDGDVGNRVQGNQIGVIKGKRAPNNNSGVIISLSRNNLIGSGTMEKVGAEGGNVISGNQLYGVLIAGNPDLGRFSDGNIIDGNHIGVDGSGAEMANSADGVFLLNARSNKVGREGQGNVISGNKAHGVRVFGTGSSANEIFGNLIGLGVDGATNRGNGGNGVVLDNAGAGNTVQGNTISGNAQSGVLIASTLGAEAGGSKILGNTIGWDKSRLQATPNGGFGVQILGASNNAIGAAGVGNHIGGNALAGIQIYSSAGNAPAEKNTVEGNFLIDNAGDGAQIINGSKNRIGGGDVYDPARNVISGNRGNGVVIDAQRSRSAKDNIIGGNVIGVNVDGVTPQPNAYYGILVNNAEDTTIGHASAGSGAGIIAGTQAPVKPSNVISANGFAGINLIGDTTGTRIQGNFIGTDAAGRAIADDGSALNLGSPVGIMIGGSAKENRVGDGAPGLGNIITHGGGNRNAQVGVQINSPEATSNVIAGNLIGLDSRGRSGANSIGVLLSNSVQTWVGDLNQGRAGGNVISGNRDAGVEITGDLGSKNLVVNNHIGSDVTGRYRPLPYGQTGGGPIYNPSQMAGVLISGGEGHIVGAKDAENTISGNHNGVEIFGQNSRLGAGGNLVQHNKIGTDPTGMLANPNYQFGVLITASPNNQILDNVISANGLAGVQIFGGSGSASNPDAGEAAGLGTIVADNKIGVNKLGEIAFAATDGVNPIDSMDNHPEIKLPDENVVFYGFQSHGVVIIGASSNQIGAPGKGNTIKGNIYTGVYISRQDNRGVVYAAPAHNLVQSNDIVTNGVYGVLRYDAPSNNPVIEPPAPNRNSFEGNPISIGDYVTGFDAAPPARNQIQSILLPAGWGGNSQNQNGRPNRPAPGRPLPNRPLPGRPLPGRPQPGRPLPGRPLPSRPLPSRPLPSRPLPGRQALAPLANRPAARLGLNPGAVRGPAGAAAKNRAPIALGRPQVPVRPGLGMAAQRLAAGLGSPLRAR